MAERTMEKLRRKAHAAGYASYRYGGLEPDVFDAVIETTLAELIKLFDASTPSGKSFVGNKLRKLTKEHP